MNAPYDADGWAKVSFVSCSREDARVLTVLDDKLRTRCLPRFAMSLGAGQSPNEQIRQHLGPTLCQHLRHLVQVETVIEHGKLCIYFLALIDDRRQFRPPASDWWPLFDLFPWEDWRKAPPKVIGDILLPKCLRWNGQLPKQERRDAAYICALFGAEPFPWIAQNLAARFALLYQAGLLPEALRDRSGASISVRHHHIQVFGQTMYGNDRLQLAKALSQLRKNMSHSPMVKWLLPDPFSLGDLQKILEHITGIGLHTQNFRRDVLRSSLIEPSTQKPKKSMYKSAKLYQWNPAIQPDISNQILALPKQKINVQITSAADG